MTKPAPTTPPAADRPIEIFRSGKFVDGKGREVVFTAEQLARTAALYDPAVKAAPIVRGHKIATDTPAAGWIAKLSYDAKSDRLRATPEKIVAQFAEEVAAGAYRYVSAAYYLPDQPNNPVPGEYYLHHVAALGAAAPAVAGLKPLAFEQSPDGELLVFTAPIAEFGVIQFGEGAWRDLAMLRLFRSVKNLLIEKFSTEDADKALPESELAWLQEQAARDDERARDAGPRLSFSHPTEETDVTKTTEETDALAKRVAAQEAELAKALGELRFAECTRYAEGLVAARKLPSGLAPVAAALLANLPADEAAPLAFAETVDGKSVETKLAAQAALKRLLDGLPEMVAGGEAAPRKDAATAGAGATFEAPPGYAVDPAAAALHAQALAYAEKHKVDIVTAAKAAGAR